MILMWSRFIHHFTLFIVSGSAAVLLVLFLRLIGSDYRIDKKSQLIYCQCVCMYDEMPLKMLISK